MHIKEVQFQEVQKMLIDLIKNVFLCYYRQTTKSVDKEWQKYQCIYKRIFIRLTIDFLTEI
jgi:hypothetical protein